MALISLQYFFLFFSQQLHCLSAKTILPLVGDNEHVQQILNKSCLLRGSSAQRGRVTWTVLKKDTKGDGKFQAFRDQLEAAH